MRISKNSNKTVIVLSGAQGTFCPTISIAEKTVKISDDYKGGLKVKNGIFSKIRSL
jgi:hypothetical protein